MNMELLKTLQKREFGNIWNVGCDYDQYLIYMNDSTKMVISDTDFDNISKYDEDLFDFMNKQLQN